MATKDKWTKAYHNFMVYFPIIVILSIILLIYTTYVFTYITILLQTDYKPVSGDNSQSGYYAFRHTSSASSAETKGIILIIFESFFLFMLLISIFRTILVNPGFIPSPLDLEYKLILNHPKFKKFPHINTEELDDDAKDHDHDTTVISDLYSQKNSTYLQIKESLTSFEENIKFKTDINFYKRNGYFPNKEEINPINSAAHLEEILGEAPMTAAECISLRSDINYFIDNIHVRHIKQNQHKKNNTKKNPLDTVLESFKEVNMNDLKLCPTCLRMKVERSHHCRMCGKCILKMDHHCPWLANCIGFRNYKYFLLVHLYGIIGTFIVTATYWEVIVNSIISYNTSLIQVGFVIFVYVCNLGMFSFLMWLFITNWRLMLSGQTIIENSDRERFKLTNTVNIYDLGCYKNFTTVFGKNPLVWFIPFFANEEGCGVIFEHRKINEITNQ
jgi:hypothetical protein